MRYTLVFLTLFLYSIAAFSQRAEPIFTNQADSIQYAELQLQFSKIDRFFERKKMDSLVRLRDEIWKRSFLGYRYNYVANQTYTQYEDLRDGEVNPLEVTTLSISNYTGEDLPEEVYTCTNLKELELVNTSVGRISRKLNSLKNLWYISILDNNLHGEKLVLKKNKHVTFLKIRSNQSGELPKNFRKFKALDSIDLIRNLITSFPVVNRNKNLRQLTLSENSITLAHDKIRKNKSLTNLVLRQNKIEIVPGSFGKFRNLEKLNLSYNNIRAIEDGVAKLENLKELSLYNNQLEEIPKAIFSLTNLRIIDLYFNKLKGISDDIRNLKDLEILYASNNSLYRLPEGLGDLHKLRELYIHHNQLSYFPERIGELSSLEVIRFNNNDFMSFPEKIFNLKNLENIDFSRNKINSLSDQFDALHHLKLLVMVENPWQDKSGVLALTNRLRDRGITVHLDSYTTPIDDIDE